MKAVAGSLSIVAAALLISTGHARPQASPGPTPLPWAYGVPASGSAPPETPVCQTPSGSNAPKHVAGSTSAFTPAQIHDCYGPADWYAQDHPAMPDVVAHGRQPDVVACAFCHYPNGAGRPDSAALAGLSVVYFTGQMTDFKKSARTSADPRNPGSARMSHYAQAMTDADVKAAAEYFAGIAYTSTIKVVESATAPKTRLEDGLFVPLDGNSTEALGNRIVEVPADPQATIALRDPKAGFIAYVPVGSVKIGRDLVENGGNGKTLECDNCHAQGLKGIGIEPPLAGRSPSYMARELYDFQHGFRKGKYADLMSEAVANLTPDDITAISAYLATLKP